MPDNQKPPQPAKPNDFYRSVLDKTEQGFCIIEVIFDGEDNPVDYRFLEVNEAFEEQTGIEEAVGRRMRDIQPDHEEFWFETYGGVANTGESVRFEHEAKPLMGGWYDVNAFRVGGPDSRRVGVLFEDITHRKEAERRLREQNQRKEEFLAVLAHELRNPLAPMQSALEILGEQRIDGEEFHQALGIMDRQVDQMTRLVDELIDINRVNEGRISLDTGGLDLVAFLDATVQDFRRRFEQEEKRLECKLPDGPVIVDGDAARLRQIFGNLLDNACNYTQPEGDVSVSLETAGQEAVIRVRDDGVGIDPSQLDSLFEMFTQTETAVERSTDGLGIGLSLVDQLVDLHRGSVEAHSDGRGTGSTFTVRLPLADPSSREDDGPGSEPVATISRRILVVDDRPDVADGLATLLELKGHTVEVTYSGRKALERTDQFGPVAIVLDIGLPDISGYEVCRRIRQRGGAEGVCIVAATGWGRADVRRKIREAGFDAHLVKPYPPDALLREIDACIGPDEEP